VNNKTTKPNLIKSIDKKINLLNKKIDNQKKEIEKERKCRCYLLETNLTPSLVDEIFKDLKINYKDLNGQIEVLVNSLGGDIDAAYNLACLFQKVGNKKLGFIIPRWAKSAATLLACAGEEIFMTDIAELGPLDPQITQINPMEERFEQFSPLHIQTTLEMIRNEYKDGSKELADGLLKRLQFPLTLGSFVKLHEIAEQYLVRLLKERMDKTGKLTEKPENIALRLTKQYADHGFCINLTEAKKIGLNVQEIDEKQLNLFWDLYESMKQRDELNRKKKEVDIMRMIDELPPDILDKVKSDINKTEKKGD